MKTNQNLTIVSILGILAVILGAFGSHLLKTKLSPELYLAWHTAIEYQFYHLLALFMAGFLPQSKKWYFNSRSWFLAGIILFSGSLYAICLSAIFLSHPLQAIGILTPVGGLCFILGWINLFWDSRKN